MEGVQKYTCGAGDGMFDDVNGSWVEVKEYNRLKEYLEELYELAYNNCRGLAHDELNEIVKKYEQHGR